MTEQKVFTNIELIDEKDDLNMYSYISNRYCHEYFVGYEIATLLGYKNTRSTIKNNVSKCNQLPFREYPGARYPPLDPRTILITRDGAVEILLKTRKKLTPDILQLLKRFGVEPTNRKCLTKEQQYLSSIADAFKTERVVDQYKVECKNNIYYLDMYFPDYKIVIECDEDGHADRKPDYDGNRTKDINKVLGITDYNWIRFNPDEENFDHHFVAKVIGQIYTKIDDMKIIKETETVEEKRERMMKNITRAKKNIDLEPEKPCTYCNVVKSLDQFHNALDHRDGKENICKICKNIKDQKRLQEQRETLEFPDEKECRLCSTTKPLKEYYKDKNSPDGHMRRCKECHNNQQKIPKKIVTIEEKTCNKCKLTKSVSDFHKLSKSIDGYKGACKQCLKIASEATYDKHKDKYLETKKAKRQLIKSQASK